MNHAKVIESHVRMGLNGRFTSMVESRERLSVGAELFIHPQPPRQPLTHEWIRMIYDECDAETGDEFIFAFARAIERAHGIGGDA